MRDDGQLRSRSMRPGASPASSWVAMPDGACDSHMHVFGPSGRYPMVSDRSYTPPEAPTDAYRVVADGLGIRRVVVVQPSVYGTDNACTLDAVRTLGLDARAVVVVDGSITDAGLERLHARGARGVRVNMLFRGGVDVSVAERLAGRIRGLGWHIEVLIDVSSAPDLAARLGRLGVPIVFDHMGHVRPGCPASDPGFRAMLGLLGEGRGWVKLSGAYRVTREERPPFADVAPLARALLEANAERCLWATDWPHPGITTPMPDDGALLDMFGTWVRTPAMRHRILVDNPVRLYGFTDA